MQIISNNCLGGYIYRDILNEEYQNPFIWSKITEPNFITLLEHLNKIDFNKYELKKNGTNLKDGFHVLVDNKIHINYSHFIFDPTCNNPKTDGVSVYYNKIWEYIIEKYEKRLKRFNLQDEICIALEDYPQCPYNINKILEICINNNWKVILISKQKIKSNYKKLLLLNHYSNINEPHVYAKKYKQEILDFLNS